MITKFAAPLLLALAIVTSTAPRADATAMSGAQKLWSESFTAELNGDYVQAIKHMKQIIAQGGDYYYANLRTGWLLYVNGQHADAVTYYTKAAMLEPGAITALTGLVNCYSVMGDLQAAIKTCKSALLIDAMNYSMNLRLAGFYYDAGEFAHAAAYFRKVTGLYPEDLTAANGLAWSYLKQGAVQEARAIFVNILIIDPTHTTAAEGLALCAPADS